MGIAASTYYYSAGFDSENAVIADWLLRLTAANQSWGFGLCFLPLRNVKKFTWKQKRVYRIYRELELNLRIRPSLRINRPLKNSAPTPPTHPG